MRSEHLGVPSFGIMTSKFVSAAEMMSRALGAEKHSFVVIDHPISSASDADLAVQAELALRDGVPLLLRSNS